MKRKITILFFIAIILSSSSINSQTIENSYPVNTTVPRGGSILYFVSIGGTPSNAAIVNVEAKFTYIAYNGVQSYVSARFARGGDPGTSGGVQLVSQGNLPSGNPGTYGYVSLGNFGNDNPNSNYYFRFFYASNGPAFDPTISTIYVRVTYAVIDLTYPSGGQTFYKNYSFPINWTSTNLSSPVNIHLYKGGSFNSVIQNNVPNSGSYNYTIPVALSNASDYSIGISALSGHTYDFSNNFTISSGTLTVTNPTSVTIWTMGSTYNISWTGSNINDVVAIDFYKGGTNLMRLTSSAPSSGTYPFTVPTNLTAGNDYRIGVSTFSGYVSAFSNNFTVNGIPPAAPVLTYPANNAVLTDLTPDLAWDPASGSFGYEGQVSLNSSFTSIVTFDNNIQVNNWTPVLTQYTTYYWRIRTKGSGGTFSSWSSRSFTIANSPILINPTAGYTVTSSAFNFQWSDCSAPKYELLVDNNSNFNSPEISQIHISALKNYSGTSYQISGNWLEENVYYWKVTAIYSSGFPAVSATGSFTYSPTPSTSPTWVPIYRAYKPSDVDHFYCTSETHLDTAIINGYDFEKVEGYLSSTPFQTPSLKSIFRFNIKNQKSHIYTTNPSTKDSLILSDSLNNIYEGIIGFTYGTQQSGLVKLYHTFLFNGTPALIDYFYTISDIEKNRSINRGYTDRGFIAYVSPFGGEFSEPWMDMQPEIGYGINPQNGNVGSYNKTSFNIPGAKTSLSFMHIYNSFSTRLLSQVNPIGAGWSHSYMATLSTYGDRIYVIWPGGGVHEYNQSDLKPITRGVYDELTKISSSRYEIKKKDQFKYTFDILNPSVDSTAFLRFIKDRNNNTIECIYNIDPQLRRLDRVKSPEGRQLFFTYYSTPGKEHLIQQVSDPGSRTIKFEYDDDNNLTKFTDAKNQFTRYEYHPDYPYDHLLQRIIKPLGNIIENDFTNSYANRRIRSQKISITGTNLNLTYNTDFTNVLDENSKTTDFYYYTSLPRKGLLQTLVTPSGNSSFEYNDVLNPVKATKITDGKGFITTIAYDLKGNALQINKPENAVHQFLYNSFNDVTGYTDPRSKITNYGYNPTGNLILVQTSRGSTNITYNPNGTINTITDPLSRVTTLAYNNPNGNLTSSKDNMNHETKYEYDPLISTLTKVTDANNKHTSYTYDNNDLLLSAAKTNSVINYGYNANDNLINITNPNSNATSFGYDDKDMLKTITNPASDQIMYNYNQNGTVSSKKQANNNMINYSYDPSNRLSSMSGNISGTITNDNNDNIQTIDDASGSISYGYDGLNRIISYTHNGNTVSYGYDQSDNIISITYPGNKVVQYTYYDDNLLQSVMDWNNNMTSYIYRTDGSILEIQYPNGTKKNYTYDAAGRVIGISNKKANGTIISEYNFTLDNVGNHVSISQTEPFTVSSLLASTKQYTYNSANRLLTDGNYTYNYDQSGNLIHKFGSDTVHYGYDAENRLSFISGEYEAGFTYDILGNRHSSNISGNIKKYILDVNTSLPRVLMETDNNGNVQNYYVYGLELISRIKPNNSTEYYHTDFRGSVIAMTDVNQSVTNKYSYGPFGEILQKSEVSSNPFKYVGGYGVMEEGVGLYFMRARFYDANTGRFISEDPVWDVNLYAYGENNPLIKIDPSGLIPSEKERKAAEALALIENLYTVSRQSNPYVKYASAGYSIFRIRRYWNEKRKNPNGKTTDSKYEIQKEMLSFIPFVGTYIGFIEMEMQVAVDIRDVYRYFKRKK